MSSAISGKNGMVNFSASDLVEAVDWTITFTGETADVTSFDSAGWREFLATLKTWSGTFRLLKTAAPPIAMHASATLKLEESQTLNQFFTGTAIITGLNTAANANGDPLFYEYSFTGTGALTVPTA